MVDYRQVPGDPSSAPPGRRRWGWRRILHWVLMTIGFGIPAVFIVGGGAFVIAGVMQTSAQWHDDLLSSGIVFAVFGAIWAAVAGVVVLMSRRRRSRRSRDEELVKVLDGMELSPAERTVASGRMEAAFAPPAVPAPVSVILPWTVPSRPSGTRNPWWLLPAFVVVWMPVMGARAGASRTMLIWFFAVGVVLAFVIGFVQWAYVFQRRLTVDDVNVTFRNAFGRTTVVARSDIKGIALRIVIGQRVTEDRALMLGPDGRCLVRIARFGLTYEQAAQAAGILRVPIDGSWDHPATFDELQREFPGSTTWPERHRVLFSIVVLIPLLLFAGSLLMVSRLH